MVYWPAKINANNSRLHVVVLVMSLEALGLTYM